MLQAAHGQAFSMWVISPVAYEEDDFGYMRVSQYHNMYQPRLFPLAHGVRFECPVFERLDWSLERAGVTIQNTDAEPVFHPVFFLFFPFLALSWAIAPACPCPLGNPSLTRVWMFLLIVFLDLPGFKGIIYPHIVQFIQ